ncbi:uncharacterized protein I303_102020 [Kwoniella dejecticola CBS 10117]|uniref:Uncharacterized protein n=1 Tax=Kwoniella dejecticola CBS 10117 TaxID=1296121 RepID=A0A1A6AC50_9TREE|nr:uncharacterized protein I303_01842 [Kwoniella dejecticola CBS 10117]OBR87634.1 hypothetical protein I303_01842 [Kwoniella dejecticola CBS 10117]
MELEIGVPSHRTTSPPHTQLQAKRSFLSKLRRASSSASTSTSTSPYGQASHAASTSAIPTSSNIRQNSSTSGSAAAVKKNQVGVPIMMGINRSEEIFGPSTSIKHGFGIEDELEWERVRTLPRVRLVPPPEEQTEPIMLYPPPHMTRPATPPPVLPHPLLSPPTSPPTSPPRRPGSPPQSPPRRPMSIYSQSPTWAGMADGFVMPPPKFSRNSVGWSSTAFGGGNIVMPKKREEVAEDRRKRMSGINMTLDNGSSPPTSPPLIVVSGMMRSLESQEEIAANKRMRVGKEDSAMDVIGTTSEEGASGIVKAEASDIITSPEAMEIDRVPTPPIVSDQPASPTSAPSSAVPSSETADSASSVQAPIPKSVRRSRALSLSAALSSSSLKNAEVPPLPDLPRPQIRKQRSLKKFFFSSSTPPDALSSTSSVPPVPPLPLRERISIDDDNSHKDEKPHKGKKILQRAESKPSLKIDTKTSKSSSSAEPSPLTPALSTGKTDMSAVMNTPSSASVQPRGLSKRFSLSNMSQAFKKKSHSMPISATSSGSPVPMVPALPEAYKKGKKAINSKEHSCSTGPMIGKRAKTLNSDQNESVVTASALPRRSESLKAIQSLTFLSDEETNDTDPSTPSSSSIMVEEPRSLLPAFEVPESSSRRTESPTQGRPSTSDQSIISISTIDIDDIDGDLEDEHEVIHAQLMHVSPRTRRDPSQALSLQEFLASPPGKTTNVVIVPPQGLRRSVEAVVMLGNPMLLNLQSPPTITSHQENDEAEGEEEATAVVQMEEKRQSRVLERRGSETESEEEISTPMEEMVEMFPDHQDAEAEEQDEPTPKASASRISQTTTGLNVDADKALEGEGEQGLAEIESLPSDMVLVETPPQLPNIPSASTATSADSSTGSNGEPKKRFASPEALLKRLHSARKQNQHQSTPYNHHSKRASKSNKDGQGNRDSLIFLQDIPLPPLPAGSDQLEFSSLSREMQLRSLKFESLGLDFQDWNEAQLEELLAGA